MALWLPNNGQLYLPPARPVPQVQQTDEYVIPTKVFFHASTERLLQVGHPYYSIVGKGNKRNIEVPKVSPNQYRVFRLKLPDPNQFALIDQHLYDPNEERLVWQLRGVEVDRGGPLGIGATGHPLLNKLSDTENPLARIGAESEDERVNMSFEPKQTQILMVGCQPPVGQHWDVATPCKPLQPGECPPIELRHTTIEDGDMCDIGFGPVNFKTFSQDRATASLDVIDTTCKWPDFLQMSKSIYGDTLFFFAKKEQLYARHFAARSGQIGDPVPSETTSFYIPPNNTNNVKVTSHIYMATPSGSLTSSDGQIFGRPYWLQRAQGTNNGICWNNDLFVTVMDNTRATNFTLSVFTQVATNLNSAYKYKSQDFKQYTRHTEEYELEFVFQLCKVPLTADVLANIHVMNPSVLENWKLAFVPPPPQGLEDRYRYIKSFATRCPTAEPSPESEDPYAKLNFWTIDLRDRFTSDLSQTSLGRRFLFQMGMLNGKRPRSVKASTSPKPVKRRKTKA